MLALTRKHNETVVVGGILQITVVRASDGEAELMLTRCRDREDGLVTLAVGQTMTLRPDVHVALTEARHNRVRLSFDVPRDVVVFRKELGRNFRRRLDGPAAEPDRPPVAHRGPSASSGRDESGRGTPDC